MKNNISFILAIVTCLTVITQYVLMAENRVASLVETTIRFFSFFTILTNTLVAVYFTSKLLDLKNGLFSVLNKTGSLTAITVYISIVGLVYQILLRPVWDPQGLQRIVDELLHSAIPVAVILFWYFYEEHTLVKYKQIWPWLIYPLIYLIYILIRGNFSNFYPYPFVDVLNLGLNKVLQNSGGLLVVFIGMSALFIRIGKTFAKR